MTSRRRRRNVGGDDGADRAKIEDASTRMEMGRAEPPASSRSSTQVMAQRPRPHHHFGDGGTVRLLMRLMWEFAAVTNTLRPKRGRTMMRMRRMGTPFASTIR